MMPRIRTCVAAAAAFLALAGPAATRPLEAQLPTDRAACYERIYDAAHLAAHPRQKVVRIRLIHPPDQADAPVFVTLEFQLLRHASAYKLFGFCEGKGLALSCRPEWDAGTWRIEVGPDGALDVINGDVTVNPANYDAEDIAPGAVAISAAPDDKRWRLYRQSADKPCEIR